MDERFDFTSGRLCLDFVNTASTHEPPTGDDLLTFEDLVAWSVAASILTAEEMAQLRQSAAADSANAARQVDDARQLREALYRIFGAHLDAGGEGISQGDVETVQASLGSALANMRTTVGVGGEVERLWKGRPTVRGSLLWPVVVSAMELWTSDSLVRVARCGGEDCDWLFVVSNRGRARRWCSMSSCGNRAKAKRHYQKVRAKPPGAGQPV